MTKIHRAMITIHYILCIAMAMRFVDQGINTSGMPCPIQQSSNDRSLKFTGGSKLIHPQNVNSFLLSMLLKPRMK